MYCLNCTCSVTKKMAVVPLDVDGSSGQKLIPGSFAKEHHLVGNTRSTLLEKPGSMSDSIPGDSCPHADASLSKTLNLKLCQSNERNVMHV